MFLILCLRVPQGYAHMQTETASFSGESLVGEYWTRWKHGNRPVQVWETDGSRTYVLDRKDGKVRHTTARSLLTEVCGKDPHITFARYFRLGKHSQQKFQVLDQQFQALLGSRALVFSPMGIDLEKRGHEVRKILMSKFGFWISTYGYDPEDVLQEVNLGLLNRNTGKGVFDPRRSSFSHYVYMVCRSVLSNYHRKERKRAGNESSGLWAYTEDGDRCLTDVGSHVKCAVPHGDLGTEEAAEARLIVFMSSRRRDAATSKMAMEILPLVREGYKRKEIAKKKDWTIGRTSRVLRHLKMSARTWSEAR